MRSIPLMAVSTFVLAAAWACGDDGGNVGPNTPPVAAFTAPTCNVGAPCTFTDASTDADGTIASQAWNFGDGNTAAGASVTNTYAAAGTFTVTLTVTDNAGATGTASHPVTVGGSGNQNPTASFDLPACTAGTPCGFHSTSTDADGTIAAAHWDFGDQGTGEGTDATHTYAAAGTFTVTLTVTDDLGGTGTATQQITVTPPSSQNCTTTGTQVNCALGINARSTVKITLVSRSCELAGNRLTITAPVPQTVFANFCFAGSIGQEYNVTGTLDAGSQLALRFFQGTPDPGDPATGDPGIRINGTYPNWTLNIDDGGNAGAQGEPDFDDAVVLVQATAAP